jgi:hypothetical protein
MEMGALFMRKTQSLGKAVVLLLQLFVLSMQYLTVGLTFLSHELQQLPQVVDLSDRRGTQLLRWS